MAIHEIHPVAFSSAPAFHDSIPRAFCKIKAEQLMILPRNLGTKNKKGPRRNVAPSLGIGLARLEFT